MLYISHVDLFNGEFSSWFEESSSQCTRMSRQHNI